MSKMYRRREKKTVGNMKQPKNMIKMFEEM